ncbi:uncharacterized protein LOC120635965 [Pararge aegeria]|uniref:uncharacterized protein LOC120635965 n=1 Tax=Pararge aegeria TaxID=116150 RepID=UPI0019D2F960|nr:uncharacterized protein LOC120635965 [Pararge aegeria]
MYEDVFLRNFREVGSKGTNRLSAPRTLAHIVTLTAQTFASTSIPYAAALCAPPSLLDPRSLSRAFQASVGRHRSYIAVLFPFEQQVRYYRLVGSLSNLAAPTRTRSEQFQSDNLDIDHSREKAPRVGLCTTGGGRFAPPHHDILYTRQMVY